MLHRLSAGMAAIAASLALVAGFSIVLAADYGSGGGTHYSAPGEFYAPTNWSRQTSARDVVTAAPQQPQSAQRPSSWPGERAPAGQWQTPAPPRNPQTPADSRYVRYPRTPYPTTPYPATPQPTPQPPPQPATQPTSNPATPYPVTPHPVASYPETPHPSVPHPSTPHPRLAGRPQHEPPRNHTRQHSQPNHQQREQAASAAGTAQPTTPDLVLCENAVIMARVGSLAILFGEVNIGIDEIIEQNRDRIPPNQIELQRKLLLKKRLQDKIKTMLVYLDAKRSIPPEGFPQIEQSLSKQFETEGVKNMMKKAKLSTRAEMDARLQSLGTSLEREKRTFIQNMIAAQWIREQVDADEEVTHAQMLKWYEQNRARFEKPPRARWEELKANFSRYPSRAEAFAAIAAMGNRVQQGEPFAQVAAASSNGSTASEGGDRDWTNVGVLASKELERALFGLPRGKLSPIIETRTGYCIVRVTERVDVTCTPFGEAQAEIRELIKEERREKQRQAYVAKLREQIPVWTMFDAEEKAAAEAARRKDPPRYSRY